MLAWIGGVAMLVRLVLFFALAVSNGWIGETGRVLLAAAGSLGLLGIGVWLHDARGRTDAALVAVATGIAGLFITITVAARVYDLVPAEAGFVLALVVGAVATWIAVAWEARVVGALGIVGALLGPAFVGAPSDQGTMALLFAASASAVAVLIWQRWDWLGFAVVLVTAPQWIVWVGGDPGVPEAIIGMTLFGLVGAAAAVGYELRVKADGLRPSSSFLLSLNAVLLATAGSIAFGVHDHEAAVKAWLAALAVAHLCLGLIGLGSERVARELSLLVLVIAVVLGDLAFAATFSGPLQAAGFAGTVVLFGMLGRRAGLPRVDLQLVSLGLGGHVALAIGSTLLSEAPPELLVEGGTAGAGALTAIASVAASCLISSTARRDPRPRVAPAARHRRTGRGGIPHHDRVRRHRRGACAGRGGRGARAHRPGRRRGGEVRRPCLPGSRGCPHAGHRGSARVACRGCARSGAGRRGRRRVRARCSRTCPHGPR